MAVLPAATPQHPTSPIPASRRGGPDGELRLNPGRGSPSSAPRARKRSRRYASPVHVKVAPVPSSSALVWVEFARGALAEALADPERAGMITPEVEVQMTTLLDSWEEAARHGPTLCLAFDIPHDEAEFLVHAFLRLADQWTVAADRRGFDISPPEGDDFYAALVDAVIAAMQQAEDVSGTEYGETLRTIWPRVDRLEKPGEEPDPGEGS